MTMIAVRPEDRVPTMSPLERKRARGQRLVLERRVIDAVAASSIEYLASLERSAPAK